MKLGSIPSCLVKSGIIIENWGWMGRSGMMTFIPNMCIGVLKDSLNVISYGCTPGGLALAACVYCGD